MLVTLTKPSLKDIERLENETIYNGAKTPDTPDIRDTAVKRALEATLRGNKVTHQTTITEKTNNSSKAVLTTGLTYRELQQLCKQLKLKANGSRAALEARIDEERAKHYVPKPKPRKHQPRTAYGMNYRSAQHLVTWAKANLVGYAAPCKNIGWDNVEHNVDAILDNAHFWALVSVENDALQSIIDETGLDF